MKKNIFVVVSFDISTKIHTRIIQDLTVLIFLVVFFYRCKLLFFNLTSSLK